MWWLIGVVVAAAWTAACAFAARGCGRRFWIILAAGYAFNLYGFTEGAIREKQRHYRALHRIEAAPPAPQSH